MRQKYTRTENLILSTNIYATVEGVTKLPIHSPCKLSMDWDSGIPHGKLLLITQLEVITPTTIAGTFYGISFAIFCLYIHSMVPRLQKNGCQRRATFMLCYSAIIMICGLYIIVSNAWVTQDAFVKHNDYPGGPWAYVESTLNTQPVIAASLGCQFGIDTLTSMIQVHSCFSPFLL
jgi:hypothetical protein